MQENQIFDTEIRVIMRQARLVMLLDLPIFWFPPGRGKRSTLQSSRSVGITLLELLLAVAMVSLLVAIAVPMYTGQVDKAKTARAIGEIGEIQLEVDRYDVNNRAIPLTLAEAGVENTIDPWGNPYQYFSLQNCEDDKCLNPDNEKVEARRDGNLKPINTFFDLYSMGKDGESRQSLTSNESQDDIVRALDGAFIGLASEYSPK